MMMRRYVIVVVVVSSILLFLFSTIKRTFFVPLVLSLSLYLARAHSLSFCCRYRHNIKSSHVFVRAIRFEIEIESNQIKSNRYEIKNNNKNKTKTIN